MDSVGEPVTGSGVALDKKMFVGAGETKIRIR